MSALILASSSPTRAAQLSALGINFVQVASNFDEDLIRETRVQSFVYKAAQAKMQAAIKQHTASADILCADSLVSVGGAILKKPRTLDEARRALECISGAQMCIVTATLLHREFLDLADLSAACYAMKPFARADVERYLKSGEWRGKAGGCMMEGFCAPYVESSRGNLSTAMGLSVEKFLPFIADLR